MDGGKPEQIPPSHIHISASLDELACNTADFFVRAVNTPAEGHRQLLVALSGGSTPYPVYRLLSKPPFREQIPWEKMHIFWVDERMVPANHEENNYYQANKHLLSLVPLQKRNIHRVKSEQPPRQAARNYADQLSHFIRPGKTLPIFDFIFLGLGEDGHTGSLFPGKYPTEEMEGPVIAVSGDYQGRPAGRVTFTPSLINEARFICFLVSGKEKAEAVKNAIQGIFDPQQNPAQRIKPGDGEIVWMLDEDAASRLELRGGAD